MAERCSYSNRRDSHFFTYSNAPSFSSTLLEEIYRSIDQGGDREEVVISMRKKRADATVRTVFKIEEEMANYQSVEKWMEKKVTEKIVVRGKSMADFQQVKMLSEDRQGSSSSSSDSSCGGNGSGGFSSFSSEGEHFPVINRPKPVRTGGEHGKSNRISEIDRLERRGFGDQLEQESKHESGFLKTKSRALKIYGDLKKSKQPISPGRKVAAFFNSLFTAGNLKKPKFAVPCGGDRDSPLLKSTNSNTSSSPASSFSRSCLSKTSSKSSGGGKRSVRFSPVSIIVEEGRHTCSQKSSYQGKNTKNNDVDYVNTAIDEELMMHIMEKSRRAEEAARDFLMNNHKKDKMECESELPLDHLSKINVENREFYEEEDEDEGFDAASCASSDLFELNDLSAIGVMERYREELPVYETTDLEKIRIMQMI